MKHEAMMRYTLAVYFASGVGPCTGLVEPFKLLLRVTTHPQFLVLELRCPWALDWDNTVYEISVAKILVLINFGRVNVL